MKVRAAALALAFLATGTSAHAQTSTLFEFQCVMRDQNEEFRIDLIVSPSVFQTRREGQAWSENLCAAMRCGEVEPGAILVQMASGAPLWAVLPKSFSFVGSAFQPAIQEVYLLNYQGPAYGVCVRAR